jgi:thiosulfate/3-mercaptopyruvate sulfurtransferase
MNSPSLRHLLASSLTVLALAGTVPSLASAAPGLIVSQAEFRTLSQQAGVKILDIRSEAEYAKGHVAGAIHLPWQALNVSERDGIRNEYADDAQIEQVLRQAGISYDDTLLIYGATSMAGRTYVVLEYAGFDKLHVLDGGLSQWKGNGRFLAASEDGVIPSAKAIPVTDFLNKKTSEVRNRQDVLNELAAKGITPDKAVVSYCGSGAFASSSYLFLKDLGFNNVKFYDKSWDDWSRANTPQTLQLANFNFAGDALNQAGSLGPKFLDEAAVRAAQKAGAVVVDVRPADDYVVGRIPDSVNVYWNDTLNADRTLKSSAELRELFAKQGVTANTHVVIFARGGLQLAQAYTVLKLLGVEQVDAFEGKWEGWVNPGYGPFKG